MVKDITNMFKCKGGSHHVFTRGKDLEISYSLNYALHFIRQEVLFTDFESLLKRPKETTVFFLVT